MGRGEDGEAVGKEGLLRAPGPGLFVFPREMDFKPVSHLGARGREKYISSVVLSEMNARRARVVTLGRSCYHPLIIPGRL